MPRQSVIVRGLNVAGIELADIWYPSGARSPQLSLDEIEILLVAEGELTRVSSSLGARWKTGMALLRRLDMSTQVVATRECRVVSVRVPMQFRGIDGRRLRTSDGIVRLPHGAADDLRRLHREIRGGAADDSARLEGLAILAVSWADEAMHEQSNDVRRPRWMTAVMEALSDVSRSPSLRKLGASVGVDPAHLARVFRRLEGCSIGEYQRRLRVAAASRLIQSSDAPLAQIALAAGFTDQAHLSRIFKRQMGTTPREYRNSISRGSAVVATPQLAFDPIGKYPFRSTTADGRPYGGTLEISGSPHGYRCIARTTVMPDIISDSVAIHGHRIVMTASVPAGVAVIQLSFDRHRFTGEWRLAGRATALNGYRA